MLPQSNFSLEHGIDLETKGTDPSLPDSRIVGVGLANREYSFYVHLDGLSTECAEYLMDALAVMPLVAFNTMFDGGFLWKHTGRWLNWFGCSYHLYKSRFNHGYPGQKWNLETAQEEALGWDETNKTFIQAALDAKGLTKADMWQLDPLTELGPYCAIDADAALQLWDALREDCEANGFHYLLEFHKREVMTEIMLLAEQQLRGMLGDYEGLKTYHTNLLLRIQSSLDAFRNHPQVAHHIRQFDEKVMDAWKRAAPAQYTKKGEVNKNWEKRQGKTPKGLFNLNSKQQLADLFYKKIFTVVKERKDSVVIQVAGKEYEVDKTETGQLSVKKQILPMFGEPGALLVAYNKLTKEEGYVRAALALLEIRTTIHPQMNSHGTITGRMASSAVED